MTRLTSHSTSTIRFVLDGKIISVEHCNPQQSILNYLRESANRKGCKEGCAEGDCGACTVVIGEAANNRLQLRAVNACIQLLPMLHGKALFTVESLKPDLDSPLHPVQQAMVDQHGSQCGFCTPGFIMSLFALFKQSNNPDRKTINDALSGNLCRCTGYRPIIDAALCMSEPDISGRDDWIAQPATSQLPIQAAEQHYLDLLESLDDAQSLKLISTDNQFFAPATSDDLAEYYQANPQATLIAGNTDVGLWINKKLDSIESIISISHIKDLRYINIDDEKIAIGASVSISDAFSELQKEYPELEDLFRRFASMPVRNAATLVGNIANGSPIGDSMPVLIALGSQLALRLGDERRIIAMDKFYLGYQQKDLRPGEWIEALHIPRHASGQHIASYKVSKRFDQDISAVCAAFVAHFNDNQIKSIRIAFGGMAAIPARAKSTEQVLQNLPWKLSSIEQSLDSLEQDFSPLNDMRSSSTYRMSVAKNLLKRFYLSTQKEQAVLSLAQLSEIVR